MIRQVGECLIPNVECRMSNAIGIPVRRVERNTSEMHIPLLARRAQFGPRESW